MGHCPVQEAWNTWSKEHCLGGPRALGQVPALPWVCPHWRFGRGGLAAPAFPSLRPSSPHQHSPPWRLHTTSQAFISPNHQPQGRAIWVWLGPGTGNCLSSLRQGG